MADLQRGHSDDPVAAAAVDTAVRWAIPSEHFAAFFHSMAMDLTVTEYATYHNHVEFSKPGMKFAGSEANK